MTTSTLIEKSSSPATRVAQAARIHKVIPLLAIMPIAALAFGGAGAKLLLAGAVYVFAIITLGMHFNAITDRDLDLRTKPHLNTWTLSAPRALRTLMVVELALACAALLLAFAENLMLAVALLVLGVLSVLYSFNFLVPHRGAELRAKVHFLGHFFTIWGSYSALWLAGISASRHAPPLAAALPFAMAWGLVDYGLFLHESATDAEEEREAGLKTLPALLGRVRTSRAAASLLLGGAILVERSLQLCQPEGAFWLRVLLALQVLGCLFSALAIHSLRSASYTERLVDVVFWSSRCVPLLGLIS